MHERLITLLLAGTVALPAAAADLVPVKKVGVDLAAELAQHALVACRKAGFQVSAVVVDRSGDTVAALRDDLASRHTLEIAYRKANAVILSGTSTGEFARNRADIVAKLDLVKDVLVLEGGLPVRAAGALVGAIGVSGAPGGDKDAACAQAALDAVAERLEFADGDE